MYTTDQVVEATDKLVECLECAECSGRGRVSDLAGVRYNVYSVGEYVSAWNWLYPLLAEAVEKKG